ncbi:MAG TPA: cytochrome d ubiquinol oxidase subunit II [Opitutaceae bacterium]|nr:cytochrome d ubiquinol oxidase subunit II [Opitutaceae bacterium]
MLTLAVTVSLLSSLILYALMGGADFGGGMWDLLATGPRATRQRQAIANAIAPIWEGNHVWLILVVVVLFTGFPTGFAAMMTALNIPVTVMLIGIVLRGAAFIFRNYDSQSDAVQRRWGSAFGIASFLAPFFQGVILGALATGQIRVANGQVTTGFFAGWLTLFALACGVFALGLFAFLAATYLTLDAKDQADLQNDFRLRAIGSGLALVPVAGVVFLTARQGAPEIFRGLTQWWAPVLLGATGSCTVGALVALWWRRFALARVAAAGEVTLILVGWSLAQYPNLVTPDVTIANARAPEATLRLLILALAVGALVLLPSLVFLFRLFKGTKRR